MDNLENYVELLYEGKDKVRARDGGQVRGAARTFTTKSVGDLFPRWRTTYQYLPGLASKRKRMGLRTDYVLEHHIEVATARRATIYRLVP